MQVNAHHRRHVIKPRVEAFRIEYLRHQADIRQGRCVAMSTDTGVGITRQQGGELLSSPSHQLRRRGLIGNTHERKRNADKETGGTAKVVLELHGGLAKQAIWRF
jgi:hypothetical protein